MWNNGSESGIVAIMDYVGGKVSVLPADLVSAFTADSLSALSGFTKDSKKY